MLLLASVTTAPPLMAGPLRVTVPVEELPPGTDVGLKLTELGVATVTVNVALPVTLFAVAEIVTPVLLATGFVVTGNVAVVAFAATVTVAGT